MGLGGGGGWLFICWKVVGTLWGLELGWDCWICWNGESPPGAGLGGWATAAGWG